MTTTGKAIRAAREAQGISQQQLAAAIGVSQPTIQKIEDGATKRSRYLPDIEKILHLGTKSLIDAVPVPPSISKGASDFGPQDMRLLSASECGQGEMLVSSEPIELLSRPAYLGEVREGYAVLVVGESMIPAFRPGQIAVINPKLPPLRGKDMLFFHPHEERETFRATIKHLLRWTSTHWYVEQFNPPDDGLRFLTLDRSLWHAHRIVAHFDR